MSFARKVTRNQSRRSIDVPKRKRADFAPTGVPKSIEPKDVGTEVRGEDGRIQCPKCHKADHLTHMTCEEFAVHPELKAAHDELARPGHDHVRCTVCNQLIIYTIEG